MDANIRYFSRNLESNTQQEKNLAALILGIHNKIKDFDCVKQRIREDQGQGNLHKRPWSPADSLSMGGQPAAKSFPLEVEEGFVLKDIEKSMCI